jgi:hypothetical protein
MIDEHVVGSAIRRAESAVRRALRGVSSTTYLE